MSKSEELFQIYIEVLSKGYLTSAYLTCGIGDVVIDRMARLESALNKKIAHGRVENPEFQAALRVFNSPLIKALA